MQLAGRRRGDPDGYVFFVAGVESWRTSDGGVDVDI